VRLGARSYSIHVGGGSLPAELSRYPRLRAPATRAFLVCDSNVQALGKRLVRALGRRLAGNAIIQAGEASKSLATVEHLYGAGARAKLDRHSIVIAVGGGVIGDVAGYFAATWLRGLPVVHVPTTLVAQVDSAIGGKTGVNLPVGKNLVGAFHQPLLVVVDPTTLRTLPEREYRAGLAEVIKYGIIADATLFRRLEMRFDRLLRREPSELAWVIRRCCTIKARVVSQDERETTGLRAILNFGHTIGHGIEAAARYRLLHGEAIALGMLAAVGLSQRVLRLPDSEAERISSLIRRAGLPARLEGGISDEKILAAIRLDKKRAAGQVRFVLARRIGRVRTGIVVSALSIRKALERLRA